MRGSHDGCANKVTRGLLRRRKTMQGINDVIEPGFARHVSDLLQSGDRAGALALAQAGVERYPWYPTGLLMLSRCLEADGKPLDALLAMRKVQAIVPDAPVVKEALAR